MYTAINGSQRGWGFKERLPDQYIGPVQEKADEPICLEQIIV